MAEPILSDIHPPFFDKYIELVKKEALNLVLKTQAENADLFFRSVPEDKWLFKYAENKWTLKEVLQHITDTERVFSFRALAFSRKDPNIFPSFNENEYTINSNANNHSSQELIEEFLAVRKATQLLFTSFSKEQLAQSGKASSYEMSVNSIGYMIAGHFAHHLKIINEKYLNK